MPFLSAIKDTKYKIMNQEHFCKRIEKNYKYVYSLIPKEILEWIYRNCVENNKKEIL